MTVNGLTTLSSLYSTRSASSASTAQSQEVSSPFGDSSTSTISGPGKWMQELAELQQSDPDKFKEVTSAIAQKLSDEASSATGGDAKFLGELADQFSQASETGDLSALKPPGGPPPPPPPPGDASSAGDASSGDASSDDSSGSTSTARSGVARYAAQQAADTSMEELRSRVDGLVLSMLQGLGGATAATGSSASAGGSLFSKVDGIVEAQLGAVSS